MPLLSPKDALYITPRSAKAILTQIGSSPISDDVVFAINGFLDELLFSLVTYLPGTGVVGISDMDAALVKALPSICLATEIIQQTRRVRKIQTPVTYSSALWNNPACEDHLCTVLSTNKMQKRYEQLRSCCLQCSSLGVKNGTKPFKLLYGTICSSSFSLTVTFYVTTMIESLAKYLLNSIGVLAKQLLKSSVDLEDVLHAFSLDEQIKEIFIKMDLRKKLEKQLGLKCKGRNRLSLVDKREPVFMFENLSEASDPIDLIHSRIEVAEQKPSAKSKFRGSRLFTSIPFLLKRGGKENTKPWPGTAAPNSPEEPLSKSNPASPKAEYFRFTPSVTPCDESTLANSNRSMIDEFDKNKKNFEFKELIESNSTRRVSLTAQRLKTIESPRRLSNMYATQSICKSINTIEEHSDEGEPSARSSYISTEHYTLKPEKSKSVCEVEPFGKLIPRKAGGSFKNIVRDRGSSSDDDELSSLEGAAKFTYKGARRNRRNSETVVDFLKNEAQLYSNENIGMKVNQTLSRANTQLQRIPGSICRSTTVHSKAQNQEVVDSSTPIEHTIPDLARNERRRRRGLSVPMILDFPKLPYGHNNLSTDIRERADFASTTSATNPSTSEQLRPLSVCESGSTSSSPDSLLLNNTSEISVLPPSTPSDLSMHKSMGDSIHPDIYFISNTPKTLPSKRYSIAATPTEIVLPFCLCSECLNGMLQRF
ncbi:hypothetical protein K7432_000544 [Basidiobolus ranarum]|uniref:Uncharacterized protein n=1 Tax=Basidiobolus ranarum TaxID=34480 RepID=A0ABR2X4E3_9FUNG